MKKLDENCVYSLEELTSEEKQKLLEKLIDLDASWDKELPKEELFSSKYLYFTNIYKSLGEWLVSDEMQYTHKETHNAKELFYTLENIQVDTLNIGLLEENVIEVFQKNNTKWVIDTNTLSTHRFLKSSVSDDKKTIITYSKFMELFGEPQYEVTEKPKHYSKGIDTFARMEANCTKEECLAFAKGNIDKYNWREKGQDLEDYKKIVSYANWAIKLLKDEK